jgi:Uma2 family endonuclease
MTEELMLEEMETQVMVLSAPKALYRNLTMPLADFLDWKPEIADGWKYEWDNGKLIANEETMNTYQLAIFNAIMRAFVKTEEYANGAALMPEVRCTFETLGRARQPDIAYFTQGQIALATIGENPVPTFVIEVISKHDKGWELERKLLDYFTVGVQTVWYVYTSPEIVRVYSSLRQGQYCAGEDNCSAAPALPNFQMTAASIFAKS